MPTIRPNKIIGQKAITLTPLGPTGFIQLADEHKSIVDARSAYGFISSDENVMVVDRDFSDIYVVKAIKDSA